MRELFIAAADSPTSVSGESAAGLVILACILIWAMSKGGRK